MSCNFRFKLLFFFIFLSFTLTLSRRCNDEYDCGRIVNYKQCKKPNGTHTKKECLFCTENKDCKLNDGDICKKNNNDPNRRKCTMSPLLDRMQSSPGVALSSLAIFVGAMIAAGGGLGGGGVFVPTFILVLGFDTRSAAALSQATIVGGSIINLYMNFQETHPLRKHRPLTDFNTILILEPMLLAGTIIGVLLNVMLPDIITIILLIIVLGYATLRTFKKGIKMFKKESKKNKGLIEVADKEIELEENEYGTSFDSTSNSEYKSDDNINQSMLEVSLAQDIDVKLSRDHTGIELGYLKYKLNNKELNELYNLIILEYNVIKPCVFIVLVWTIVSLFNLLKEGIFFDIKKCGTLYWVFSFMSFPFLFIITLLIVYSNVKIHLRKKKLLWKPAKGDIRWSIAKGVYYPFIGAAAGLFGGLLGIGGGMIVSPLLLELGVLPRVASATSAVAVAVTCSSSTLQFYLLGMLRLDYMLFYIIIGMVGTFLGQTIVNYSIKKYGRQSIVIFAVASIIGLAVILMGFQGIYSSRNGVNLHLSKVC